MKYLVTVLRAQNLNHTVLRRSALLALIIGSMLTYVNQSSAVLGANDFNKVQLLLAYLTPFVVILLSQVLAIRQAEINKAQNKVLSVSRQFKTRELTENIFVRALFISLFVGSVNNAIVMTTQLHHSKVDGLPWFLLIQSYVLPLVFGALSQAMAYRRCITK
jgi:hypothetical protein